MQSRLIRNRVVERRRMKASEVSPNGANWRHHPDAQADVIRGILQEVGQVGELYAYYSERNANKLTLIDGHLRTELDPKQEWDVAITDLTDSEADLILATRDPIAAMASTDAEKLDALLSDLKSGNESVDALLSDLASGQSD